MGLGRFFLEELEFCFRNRPFQRGGRLKLIQRVGSREAGSFWRDRDKFEFVKESAELLASDEGVKRDEFSLFV